MKYGSQKWDPLLNKINMKKRKIIIEEGQSDFGVLVAFTVFMVWLILF